MASRVWFFYQRPGGPRPIRDAGVFPLWRAGGLGRMTSGRVPRHEAWWAAPTGGGEPPTKVGGLREDILFKSKEYPLALPKKDCQGGFRVSPLTTPLKRPKEGLRPFLWKPSWGCGGVSVRRTVGRESRAGCLRSFRGFRLVGDEVVDCLVVLAPGLGG